MSFTARYRGECGNEDCGERIMPGDEVEYDAWGDLMHVKCPEAVPEIPPDVERCPRCTGHHRGEC